LYHLPESLLRPPHQEHFSSSLRSTLGGISRMIEIRDAQTQTKSSTQLQRKVVPFVAVEMSFSLDNELRLQIILAGEKTFSHQVTVTPAIRIGPVLSGFHFSDRSLCCAYGPADVALG
jgi:hypothetical protein